MAMSSDFKILRSSFVTHAKKPGTENRRNFIDNRLIKMDSASICSSIYDSQITSTETDDIAGDGKQIKKARKVLLDS